MKIIANIVTVIVSMAIVAACIGTVWFLKWSDDFVNHPTLAQKADTYYHVGLLREDTDTYVIHEFADHVFETLGLD